MRKVVVVAASALIMTIAGAACVELFRLNSNLKSIQKQVAVEGNIPFTLTSLEGSGSLQHTAFEPVATPNRFTTGSAFAGKLYLAGPGGIAIYNQPTDTPKLLRTGIELPPAAVTAFATGRLRGQSTPSLIAATHGEGVLILSSDNKLQQLRPNTPAQRDITAILPLASGDLLIGTRRAGLLLYDGTDLKLFQPSLADIAVTALAGDEGDFWIGTRTHGLLHWHAGELDTLDEFDDKADGLPDAQVEDIAIAPQGIFAATPRGVAQIVDGRVTRTLAQGLFAHALAIDGNTLLIATMDQGLHQVSLDAHTSAHASITSARLNISHFFTADGTLLAVDAEANGNVLRHDHAAWQTIIAAAPQSLADNNVSSLSIAPDGRLWIGYFDRGVDVLDLHTNQSQHVEDDHVFCVNRIVPDAQRHTMDVATANGLVLFDASANTPRARQILSRKDGLISDQITDIAFTNTGMTLATPAGLTYFTPSGPQSLYTFQGLANNHVYALAAETTNGRVLAGTLGGVSILSDATVRRNVTLRNSGLKRNWITAIVRVPQPNASVTNGPDIWFIGTYGGGVVQMDDAGNVSPMDSVAPNAVINPNALLRTSTHVLAGSLDDGLLLYNQSTHHWSQITAGLPSRNVTALTESGGEIYIGTENGIVRIAEGSLP